MKKTHKRTVSLVLAIVICLSFSVSAFAAAMPSLLVSEVTEIVNSIMTAIEPNKSMYGLGGVDFTNLTLGQEIPAYEMKSSGPARLTEVHYFPILSAGQWVATATVSYNEEGETNVTVSRDYIDTYEAAATSVNTGAAIIFDTNSAYIYTGAEVEVVEMSTEATAGRVTLNRNVAMPVIAMSNFATVADIELENVAASLNSGVTGIFLLNVPAVQQPSTYTCWAGALSSIFRYHGGSQSPSAIVSASGYGHRMISVSEAQNYVPRAGYTLGTYISAGGLTVDRVQEETYLRNMPIYAGFTRGNVGHAVVVRGYSATTSNPTISFMDPATATFKAATASDGRPSYVNSSGVTLTYAGGFPVGK